MARGVSSFSIFYDHWKNFKGVGMRTILYIWLSISGLFIHAMDPADIKKSIDRLQIEREQLLINGLQCSMVAAICPKELQTSFGKTVVKPRNFFLGLGVICFIGACIKQGQLRFAGHVNSNSAL
jgi:hypothetical protein